MSQVNIRCFNCKSSKPKKLYSSFQLVRFGQGERPICNYCESGANKGTKLETQEGTCMKCDKAIYTGHKFGLCEVCKSKNRDIYYDTHAVGH